ncbi:MAG: hypothetical protein K6C94_03665 [Candidatus Gastranaerophilales bacterium]|nr:hypothetical protein [Candidatus Gastranaerophilales bacterium]
MANSNLLKLSQNKANIQQAADSLKQAQRGSSAAATSGTQAAAALPQMAEREVKNESIFASGSASTPPKTSVSGQEFAEALSGKTFAELNQVQKAQYQLLSAFADTDGDNSITKDEVTALDLTEDGVISQEDIDQIYEELGIGTDASVDELLDAIDEILEAKEATEAAKTGSTSPATATGSTAAAAATDAVKPEDIKGINLENSGVVPHVDANGNVTFTVQVEAWGTQADGRQANDCLTRIISNAYPDATAAEKQAIMSQICSMNPQIQDPNLIYTNDTLKLPVVNRDENGQIQFAESTKAQATDEAKSSGSTSAAANTGSSTATAATKPSGSTSATTGTASTGSTSAATRTASTGSTSAAAATEAKPSAECQELVSWINECEGNNLSKPDIMNKLLEKANDEGVDLKEFIAQYDKTHSKGFINAYSDSSFWTNDRDVEIMKNFADAMVASYGGPESKQLQQYVDKLCNNPNMGGFYYDGAPLLAQQIYQSAVEQLVDDVNKGAVDSKTSFEAFRANGAYQGLTGWNQAKADYQENVAIMNEFTELYNKYKDADVANQKVSYETYGQSDGYWNAFKTNYGGENKISDIYAEMLEDGMGSGSIDWTNFHMSMYKEALAKLQAYDKLMS